MENMNCSRMQGLKLSYRGLKKVEQRNLGKELVAEKVLLDGKGRRGSYLKIWLVAAWASSTTRGEQFCSRSPWLEGLEVDAWDTVLGKALLCLCS